MTRRTVIASGLVAIGVTVAGIAYAGAATSGQDLTCHVDTANNLSCPLPPAPTVTQTVTQTVTASAAPAVKPSPTPTPTSSTPTPTPSPTSTAPAASWPDATNTGVPAGTQLTVVAGPVRVYTDGTVIDGQDIHGDLDIYASNVTVRNTRVFGGVLNISKYGCANKPGQICNQTNVNITDTEVDGNHVTAAGAWLVGEFGAYTCTRCNVHGGGLGFQTQTGNTKVIDSYVWDIWPNSTAHKSAFGTNSASNVEVRHNSFTCAVQGCSAAMVMYTDGGNDDNWLVTGNLFSSEGSYCTYSGAGGGTATNITWTNNTYTRTYNSQCGQYGADTGWQTRAGNVWSGNTFTDGATVNP